MNKTKPLRAIILAAGRGERLMPLTQNCPKSLLDLGDGTTVLERQLDTLNASGIRTVTIVSGYKSEQIEAKTKHVAGLNIVFNPFFGTTNNLVSAWLAINQTEGDFILINGDDIFSPTVMAGLLACSGDSTIVVNRKRRYDSDDMRISIRDGLVTDIGKDLSARETNAEAIGISMFRNHGAKALREELNRLVREPENHQRFYLLAFRNLMRAGHRFHYSECRREDWAEIDFHQDLDVARKRIRETIAKLKAPSRKR